MYLLLHFPRMAYQYRSSQNDFYLFGAADQIRETEYGTAVRGHVTYPHVSTCTTLTLALADGSVIGAHFSKLDPAATVDAILNQMNVVRAGRAVSQMYIVGVLKYADADGFMGTPRYAWPILITTFNQAFGRAAGDLAQGFIQTSDERDYRAISAGAAGMLWLSKPRGGTSWEVLPVQGL
jgi:hypothetical protein